jgi:hypothetical protein
LGIVPLRAGSCLPSFPPPLAMSDDLRSRKSAPMLSAVSHFSQCQMT